MSDPSGIWARLSKTDCENTLSDMNTINSECREASPAAEGQPTSGYGFHNSRTGSSVPNRSSCPASAQPKVACPAGEKLAVLMQHFLSQDSETKAMFLETVASGSPHRTRTYSSEEPGDKKSRLRSESTMFMKLHEKFECPEKGRYEKIIQNLVARRNQYMTECHKLNEELTRERASNAKAQFVKEIEISGLLKKMKQLNQIHVRSVNEVVAGTESVSDKTFEQRLADYHATSYKWCRQNFRGKKLRESEHIRGDLLAILNRCGQWRELKISRITDLLLWAAIHHYALNPWFPSKKATGHSLREVETCFSKDDSAEHQQQIDYWRAYTMSLIFQSPGFTHALNNEVEDCMSRVVPALCDLVDGPHTVDEDSLRVLIASIFRTAAQMNCQRGFYECESLTHKADFDEDKMEDAEKTAELDGKSVYEVRALLSDGIVKRAYRGSPEIIGRISKMRVVLALKDDK